MMQWVFTPEIWEIDCSSSLVLKNEEFVFTALAEADFQVLGLPKCIKVRFVLTKTGLF